MKRFVSLLLAVLLAAVSCAAFAEGNTAVSWKLDSAFDYGAGMAVVARNDGKTEWTTIQALIESHNNNPVRFEALYENAEIIVVANVNKISGKAQYNRKTMQYGYVELGISSGDIAKVVVEAPDEASILNLNVGDLVVASGKLTSITGWKVDLMNHQSNSQTTLVPYADYMTPAAE